MEKIPDDVYDYFDKNPNARFYKEYVLTNSGFILGPEYFKNLEKKKRSKMRMYFRM